MNQIYLIGNVGKDPDTTTTQSGSKVIAFSVATSEKDKEGKETTSWHNIKGWNWIAELPITKGCEVVVVGRLLYDEYTNKDGQKVVRSYVLAQSVKVIQRFTKVTAPLEKAKDSFIDGQSDLPF